jgi:hypothetical protein
MFLTDKINSNRTDSVFDIHGRLEYENAMQSKYSDPSMPLLNAYILSFKNIIINALQVKHMPLWPDNKKACIVLTHDVDNPDKYSLLKDYRIIPRKNTDRGVVSYNYHILKTLISYLKDRNKEENWLFNKVIEAESKYNFKSTFYFASRPYSNKNGHLFDVPYHIKKRKFKKLFEELNAYNVDIGLHASYNAHKDPNLFIEEKKWLEKLTKTEVCGLRHHYWHLGKELFDTLHYHEIAGFKYDTSIAFNNHPGYRFEVAFPFYPFDVVKNKRIDVLQLPPFLMDGSLFYKEDMTVEKGMEIINPYISNLLKYNGIGVVDWHVRTSFPSTNSFNSWGKFYLEFLDYLKSKQEVWVTNAKEVYDWLDKRNKQLIK